MIIVCTQFYLYIYLLLHGFEKLDKFCQIIHINNDNIYLIFTIYQDNVIRKKQSKVYSTLKNISLLF